MTKKEPAAPSPYLTLKEVARYFRVDESTIRKGCGVFAMLQLTTTEGGKGRRGRTLVLRESVERVDGILRQRARNAADPLKLVRSA